MQSPPFPRYLVPPRSKYSPQHHVLFSNTLSFISSRNVNDQVSDPYKSRQNETLSNSFIKPNQLTIYKAKVTVCTVVTKIVMRILVVLSFVGQIRIRMSMFFSDFIIFLWDYNCETLNLFMFTRSVLLTSQLFLLAYYLTILLFLLPYYLKFFFCYSSYYLTILLFLLAFSLTILLFLLAYYLTILLFLVYYYLKFFLCYSSYYLTILLFLLAFSLTILLFLLAYYLTILTSLLAY